MKRPFVFSSLYLHQMIVVIVLHFHLLFSNMAPLKSHISYSDILPKVVLPDFNYLALCCESVYLAVKERIPRLAPVKQKSPSMVKGCSLSAEIIEARGNITFFTFLYVPQI